MHSDTHLPTYVRESEFGGAYLPICASAGWPAWAGRLGWQGQGMARPRHPRKGAGVRLPGRRYAAASAFAFHAPVSSRMSATMVLQ